MHVQKFFSRMNAHAGLPGSITTVLNLAVNHLAPTQTWFVKILDDSSEKLIPK